MTGDRSGREDREPSPVIRRDTGRRRSPTPPAVPLPSADLSRTPPPARPGRPRRRRRRRAWGRIASLSLLIVLLLASAAILGGALWLDRTLHRQPVLADYPGRPVAGRGTNWLLVGSDSREGLTPEQQRELTTGGDIGNGRTDTILLVHVPALGAHTATTMVSIPRDSYLPIPGHGRDKVNAAFALGGAPLLAQTVEQATGLRLDHYVEIGFSGFAALVDALGGVTACPEAPIDDPLAGIDLPAGCRRLDGREALGYVRTRATPRADLDRMVNQRELMSALLHRAASPAVWLNPWRWYAVPHAAADALTVDAGDHVWNLALLGWSLRGATTSVTVPVGELSGSEAGSVVVWDHDAAERLFDALAADAPVPPSVLKDQP
jgi:LCP family protein required for cell wall assembly